MLMLHNSPKVVITYITPTTTTTMQYERKHKLESKKRVIKVINLIGVLIGQFWGSFTAQLYLHKLHS